MISILLQAPVLAGACLAWYRARMRIADRVALVAIAFILAIVVADMRRSDAGASTAPLAPVHLVAQAASAAARLAPGNRCADQLRVELKVLPRGILGQAIVDGSCVMQLQPWLAADRAQFCRVFVHEWVHLGRNDRWHSSDPTHVLYPTVSMQSPHPVCD